MGTKVPARVAIVGRPNVGKSTLFNRITGKRRALVHATPGVTRDVQRMITEWAGVHFELIDTGGLFSGVRDILIQQVESKALEEALAADAMIFVTDAEVGLTPPDEEVAERVRAAKIPVFLAVNKSEKKSTAHADAEFYELGFEHVFPVSALHGDGVGDLLDGVISVLPREGTEEADDDLKLALVGRPNVGKSSLINALTGKNSQIVDTRPGTTRDSLDLRIRWYDRNVILVDTAGIRRKSKSRDGLTSLTAIKSIDAIKRADVIVMVLDATEDIARQDVRVASYAHKAAKGIIFSVNKWDLIVNKDNTTVPTWEKTIRKTFSFAGYAPILFTSALTAQRVSKILETAWAVKEARQTRLPTAEVNRLLGRISRKHPPPFYGGGNGKIYYGTQVSVSPPTFNLFVNKKGYFGRSYIRYLNNQIREIHAFPGTLIRIRLVERKRKERA